jgi:hypothetical protein
MGTFKNCLFARWRRCGRTRMLMYWRVHCASRQLLHALFYLLVSPPWMAVMSELQEHIQTMQSSVRPRLANDQKS